MAKDFFQPIQEPIGIGAAGGAGKPKRPKIGIAVKYWQERNRPLTVASGLTIVPAMNGLNAICGICRKIIR